jgi:hypothetical protein
MMHAVRGFEDGEMVGSGDDWPLCWERTKVKFDEMAIEREKGACIKKCDEDDEGEKEYDKHEHGKGEGE